MIDRGANVTVTRQAQLLALSRSSVYYTPRALPDRDLRMMRRLDELHLQWPFYGSRKLTWELRKEGHEVGRRHVVTLMRRMVNTDQGSQFTSDEWITELDNAGA